MNFQEVLQTIMDLNYKFRYYKSIESLFEYDQWSALPPRAPRTGSRRRRLSESRRTLFTKETPRAVPGQDTAGDRMDGRKYLAARLLPDRRGDDPPPDRARPGR